MTGTKYALRIRLVDGLERRLEATYGNVPGSALQGGREWILFGRVKVALCPLVVSGGSRDGILLPRVGRGASPAFTTVEVHSLLHHALPIIDDIQRQEREQGRGGGSSWPGE